jgi:outer membrane protein assembly factor BamB
MTFQNLNSRARKCLSAFGQLFLVSYCACHPITFADDNSGTGYWPQWRGPLQTGESPDGKPPVQWTSTDNIAWKTKIPGRGHSTPIVWGELVFLTTAIPVGDKLPPKLSGRPGEHDNLPVDSRYQFAVLAINRNTGNVAWQKTVHEALPIEAGHQTASLASNSAATDGEHLYAFFGSHGLYCLDYQGNVAWQRDFGVQHSKHGHGEGCSPALFGDYLAVNWDHEGQSFLVVLDKRTGKDVWRKDRREDTSWSSPIVVTHQGRQQLIVCGTNRVRGYDLQTGDTIWECGGMSSNIVATPVYSSGIVYVGSSYEKRVLMAINIDGASGDVTNSAHVLWTRTRGTPYVPSLLLVNQSLYFLTHYQNIITRIDGPTGRDSPGPIRLGALGNIYASPVSAAGHIYVTDLEGNTMVVTAAEVPRVVSANALNENVNASLAIAGSEIFIRGVDHLYCIAAGSR